MRIMKVANFRRAASLIALSWFVPAISIAGQFDALYEGISETERTSIENWHKYYPGLEEKINEAFLIGQRTGNFLLRTNQAPVAWNITENRSILINSINAGYFIRRFVISGGRPIELFPNLNVIEQNVSLTAGEDIIVTPVPVTEGGFGFALSVRSNQKAEISAGNLFVFMTPVSAQGTPDYGNFSINMDEDSFASLSANEIAIFGGVRLTPSSAITLSGRSGIYFLEPHESAQGREKHIELYGAQMTLDAPNILIDRDLRNLCTKGG